MGAGPVARRAWGGIKTGVKLKATKAVTLATERTTRLGKIAFTSTQLDRKFKHAPDFGVVTTKKNADTLGQFEEALIDHMNDAGTYAHGTYLPVPDSKVYFNSVTNNVLITDKVGTFVSGFKLTPGSPQLSNFLEKGVLR